MDTPQFFESLCTSNFSFLQAASHPEEYIERACELGVAGIAIADIDTLAGVVRAHSAARERSLPFRIGVQISVESSYLGSTQSGPPITIAVYPTCRTSYGRLCRLLSIPKLKKEKEKGVLSVEEFLAHSHGLAITLIATRPEHNLALNRLIESLPDKQLLSVALLHEYGDPRATDNSVYLAARHSLPLLASSSPKMHTPERKRLLDVLTCVKHRCTLEQAGLKLDKNGERYLKSPQQIAHLYRATPQAITRSMELLEMTSGFSLAQLRYEYPNEVTPHGISSADYLRRLTFAGAKDRYPDGVPERVAELLEQEFGLISDLGYEKYFLTCYDIVKFARSKGILCQGRGAAANSAVCYCLGITSVDPARIDLLFARFVSRERNEPPDIDIDFEHERRGEVMQYIYDRFGRERAGLGCAVITYRTRSAVRDIGKAVGLGNSAVDSLAKLVHRWTGNVVPPEDLIEIGLNPNDPSISLTFELAKELKGFPRHLTQHVGGFIICEHPLIETVPILTTGDQGRTIIEWDKDDIETLGMLKIDILALGMLSCIRRAIEYINQTRSLPTPLQFHSIPAEDPFVYDAICNADTIGVFQIESRAQMSMLPRLKPRCFYDLVIQVAIVRPGPIQGNMVHPYLRRRAGLETPYYPDERARSVLGKTLGVPLFQEQAMRLAIILAGFTPEEAEGLRRAMAAWKRDKGKIALFQARVVAGMIESGYSLEFAETCMQQIKGFSEYGFPESHAASFALLVYASAWIKVHYPAQFAAALINSQPMGFYAPAQIIHDLVRHGVNVLPVDTFKSDWDCTIEDTGDANGKMRLGMRVIKGLSSAEGNRIAQLVRSETSLLALAPSEIFAKLRDVSSLRTLELLAKADAFRSIGLSTRDALWIIRALPPKALPLERAIMSNATAALPQRSAQQSMFDDYRATGVSLKAHPLSFIRPQLDKEGVLQISSLRRFGSSKPTVSVCGVAFVKQRPSTAKGVVFISLEDETGITNLVVKPPVFERFRRTILMDRVLLVRGVLERVDAVTYINVESVQGRRLNIGAPS
jgi:error-prone DNA polymerase